MYNNISISVKNMCKYFKVIYDKPQTLKERIVFSKNKKAEKRLILNDINLDIYKGETVALLGTNGSGKSTLLKLMTKILYPSSGSLETFGKVTSLLELGAGFHDDFTGRENIYFNASVFGLNREDIDKRVDQIIEFSELGSFIDNPIRTYSSGMYMRLAFSIAINVDADILLIDEILAVGDQHFQDKCFEKLQELKRSNKTIVIVSHSLESVKQLCDRAVWIYKGEIRDDGDPTLIVSEYLKQLAIDHHKERKKMGEKAVYTGTVFIDRPTMNSEISINQESILFSGWALSDAENDNIQITIGDKKFSDCKRRARVDVLNAYEEQYGGEYFNAQPGWAIEVPLEQIDTTQEELHVEASLIGENKVLSTKKIVLKLVNRG